MADLTEIESSQSVKIAGASSSGIEDNYADVAANQNLKVQDGLKDGGVNGNLNLLTANTAYEAKVGGSRLTNRKALTIWATDSDMYWGYSNTVTPSNGMIIYKGQVISFTIDSDSNFQVWLVCGTANVNARITESP